MISSWADFFSEIQGKDYYQKLSSFWDECYASSVVYPKRENIFNAFSFCPLAQTKVVILGQDPYHEPGQAMGLSFSVPAGVALPPSLKNIYREIESDTGSSMNYKSGDLTYLAKQGVLLLNVNLTVEAHKALSHEKKEYLSFTEDVMKVLDEQDQPIVFLLLGGFAKSFAKFVTNPNHLVLEANHPSPLSANRGGFFGTHLFSRCNAYLKKNGIEEIHWGNEEFSLF